jgi:hypothetical protein
LIMRKWLYASAIAAGITFFGAAPAQAAPPAAAERPADGGSPLDLLQKLPIGKGLTINGLQGGNGPQGSGRRGGGLQGGGLPIESARKLPDASVVRTIASTGRDRRMLGRTQLLGLDLLPSNGGLLSGGRGHGGGPSLGDGRLLGGGSRLLGGSSGHNSRGLLGGTGLPLGLG